MSKLTPGDFLQGKYRGHGGMCKDSLYRGYRSCRGIYTESESGLGIWHVRLALSVCG